MKRERRYVVAKIKDVQEALSDDEQRKLRRESIRHKRNFEQNDGNK